VIQPGTGFQPVPVQPSAFVLNADRNNGGVIMTRIMDVEEVRVFVFKSGSVDVFAVWAKGHVPTTGWTNIELDPHFYLVPPKDGIMEFDFNGKAPSGIVGEVVSQVTAERVLPMPKWLKGVRVCAKVNHIDAPVGKHIPHFGG
jgi:hypothetical protein